MANDQYTIIDEPRPRFSDRFLVNPVLILLVSIFLPLVFSMPNYARVLLAFSWLIVNGVLLGSPSLLREILLALAGAALWWGSYYLIAVALIMTDQQALLDKVFPYARILSQAIFFFFLYLVVSLQAVPYAIHSYLKEQRGP